mgnify:FL=1
MANFTDNLKKGDLIESVYEGGGYGLITRKEYVWVDEDDLEYEAGLDALSGLDVGNYAFDFKDGQYKVLEFAILINNSLSTYYHFQLGKDWYVWYLQ